MGCISSSVQRGSGQERSAPTLLGSPQGKESGKEAESLPGVAPLPKERQTDRQTDPNGRGEPRYTYISDLPDSLDLQADFSAMTAPATQFVDLRAQNVENNMKPLNQGLLGSCTANAIAAAFHFDQRKEKIHAFVPSRLFIYYNEREMMGTVKQASGTSLRDSIKSISRFGICPETMWPYDKSKLVVGPPVECYQAALQSIAAKRSRVKKDLSEMMACLASGTPFVFGFSVYESFESMKVQRTGEMPMPADNEQLIGGHAACAVGYDTSCEVFIVRNSWGVDWGDGGYFYMPFEFMMKYGLDHWCIEWSSESNAPENSTETVLASQLTNSFSCVPHQSGCLSGCLNPNSDDPFADDKAASQVYTRGLCCTTASTDDAAASGKAARQVDMCGWCCATTCCDGDREKHAHQTPNEFASMVNAPSS